MRARTWSLALALLAAGCGVRNPADGSLGAPGSTGGTGLPNVDPSQCVDGWDNFGQPFFASRCAVCHQHTSEFTGLAAVKAKQAAILDQVQSRAMPQGSPLSSDELSRLEVWFACGAPAQGADGGAAFDGGALQPCADVPDPQQGTLARPRDGSRTMLPGENCLQCHIPSYIHDESIEFAAAGTVFSSATAAPTQGRSGVRVLLTDALGQQVSTTTNAAGNFSFSDHIGLTPPYKLQVQTAAGTLEMQQPAPHGACNTCHTQPSACGAPGRLYAK